MTNLTQRQLPTPREIVAHLDLFVFGQELAKRDLAVAFYNHYLGCLLYTSERSGPSAETGGWRGIGAPAVSYTHLDVYKRQVPLTISSGSANPR